MDELLSLKGVDDMLKTPLSSRSRSKGLTDCSLIPRPFVNCRYSLTPKYDVSQNFKYAGFFSLPIRECHLYPISFLGDGECTTFVPKNQTGRLVPGCLWACMSLDEAGLEWLSKALALHAEGDPAPAVEGTLCCQLISNDHLIEKKYSLVNIEGLSPCSDPVIGFHFAFVEPPCVYAVSQAAPSAVVPTFADLKDGEYWVILDGKLDVAHHTNPGFLETPKNAHFINEVPWEFASTSFFTSGSHMQTEFSDIALNIRRSRFADFGLFSPLPSYRELVDELHEDLSMHSWVLADELNSDTLLMKLNCLALLCSLRQTNAWSPNFPCDGFLSALVPFMEIVSEEKPRTFINWTPMSGGNWPVIPWTGGQTGTIRLHVGCRTSPPIGSLVVLPREFYDGERTFSKNLAIYLSMLAPWPMLDILVELATTDGVTFVNKKAVSAFRPFFALFHIPGSLNYDVFVGRRSTGHVSRTDSVDVAMPVFSGPRGTGRLPPRTRIIPVSDAENAGTSLVDFVLSWVEEINMSDISMVWSCLKDQGIWSENSAILSDFFSFFGVRTGCALVTDSPVVNSPDAKMRQGFFRDEVRGLRTFDWCGFEVPKIRSDPATEYPSVSDFNYCMYPVNLPCLSGVMKGARRIKQSKKVSSEQCSASPYGVQWYDPEYILRGIVGHRLLAASVQAAFSVFSPTYTNSMRTDNLPMHWIELANWIFRPHDLREPVLHCLVSSMLGSLTGESCLAATTSGSMLGNSHRGPRTSVSPFYNWDYSSNFQELTIGAYPDAYFQLAFLHVPLEYSSFFDSINIQKTHALKVSACAFFASARENVGPAWLKQKSLNNLQRWEKTESVDAFNTRLMFFLGGNWGIRTLDDAESVIPGSLPDNSWATVRPFCDTGKRAWPVAGMPTTILVNTECWPRFDSFKMKPLSVQLLSTSDRLSLNRATVIMNGMDGFGAPAWTFD
ncbi:unnamed protein product [Notodromas monacha]|uniref:Uncharacterized protein n=1 Tax=Notodromas monacha TaxID=399045 RepID=A0A7R9BIZ2_9CRUS|nr:unnamed protein product [Notodromas monacha]CAG0916403.1 unnamed protein product [Notodromas monacha]